MQEAHPAGDRYAAAAAAVAAAAVEAVVAGQSVGVIGWVGTLCR